MSGTARDGSHRDGAEAEVGAAKAALGEVKAELERLSADGACASGDRALLCATARGLCDMCESQISTCEGLAGVLGGLYMQLQTSVEALSGIAAAVATSPAGDPLERQPGASRAAPARTRPGGGRRGLRRLIGSRQADAEPPRSGRRADPDPETASLLVCGLGSLTAHQRGELVTEWNGQKAQLLLHHLVVEHGRRMPREFLAELLWPNADSEASRRNLHQAVYALRQTLRRREPTIEYIVFRDESYFLDAEAGIWIDFVEFEARAEAARRLAKAGNEAECVTELERAESLYSGDLFEDRLYDDHFRLPREHLRSVHLEVLSQLSDSYVREERHAEVITLNGRALALDPHDEQAHRRIIEAYIAQGQRGMALRQYDACRAVLSQELGLEPSEELQRLREKLAGPA